MFALVDCNNFFVSCERVFRPELENRPVVVLSNNDGCVVSRSNESKAMGIKMGTPFYQIRQLAEQGKLTVFSSNHSLYGDMSSRVMSVLADSVPKIEIYSVDEAYLLLDGFGKEEIMKMAAGLVRKVKKWVGIPVSIGIAPTRTLSKMASHFAKQYKGYRGVCMIDDYDKRMKALSLTPIGDVWGIGRKLSVKMREKGIETALDFIERPESWVHANFNLPGTRTWNELRGVPCEDREDEDDRKKSICTSRSFADMIEDEKELSSIVADFAAVCARKLREEGSAAGNVTVFVYTNRFRNDLEQYYPSATVRLDVAASSSQEIVEAAMKAFATIFRPGYLYKKAGVVVDGIIPASDVQNVLFDFDEDRRRKRDLLSMVMDKVNSSSSDLLKLAMQREKHFSGVMRSEYRSKNYTTSLDELIKVK